MSEKLVYGLLELSPSLYCASEVLGKSFKIKIGGCDGDIILPSLPDWKEETKEPWRLPLTPPLPAKKWKRGEKPIYWGDITTYSPHKVSDIRANVKHILLEFQVPQDGFEDTCQEIYQGFKGWIELFKKYIVLITTQGTRKGLIVSDGIEGFELLTKEKDDLHRIPPKKNPTEIIIQSHKDTSLHIDHIKKACFLASQQLQPRLEYEMLLEAYSARKDGDYRKAVIEAATALEICLTEGLLEEFEVKGAKTYGELLLKQYRTLGGRLKLVKLLNIEIPNKNYEELIVVPRNKLVHQAKFPTHAEANQVVNSVEELLSKFSPDFH